MSSSNASEEHTAIRRNRNGAANNRPISDLSLISEHCSQILTNPLQIQAALYNIIVPFISASCQFCFGQAPLNKLVPATSLLWALKKSRVYEAYDSEVSFAHTCSFPRRFCAWKRRFSQVCFFCLSLPNPIQIDLGTRSNYGSKFA